jgi:hypothetical protein
VGATAAEVTITGVLGAPWRADVTQWGAVRPWDGSPALDWWVAAEDRWHHPRQETALRQIRRSGTPVVETRVRVPGGDVVQTVYSVADSGGHTVMELRNESSAAVAVVLSRPDLCMDRPPADVPIGGVDVPVGAISVPIAHRTAVTVALAHRQPGRRPLPALGADADAVARGWLARAGRASVLDLPDTALVDEVVHARCQWSLTGPAGGDEVGRLLVLGELARMGDRDDDLGPALAGAAEAVIRGARRCGLDWDAEHALLTAGRALSIVGEGRAVDDLVTSLRRLGAGAPLPAADPGAGRTAAWVERRLAAAGLDACRLLPSGVPEGWAGANFAAHGLVAGPRTAVSYAVRWHGERPAVLWEQDGLPAPLSSGADPGWTTSAGRGEALWRVG